MRRIPLYLGTLPHLKIRQLVWFVLRRVLPPRNAARIPSRLVLRDGTAIAAMPYAESGKPTDEFAFRFLNKTKSFADGKVDWVCDDMPKLWRYNLHYFDYALHPSFAFKTIAALISDWIAHNPPGTRDAWEPYTLSLRIVNWIKFLLKPDAVPAPRDEWHASLYRQSLWLEKNIEYHILANHYLKNGKALFFAGMFFAGADADRWLRLGLKILREQADEQLLADGGHYERSPMYHSIVVCDYLDVLNLIKSSSGLGEPESAVHFEQKIILALEFLKDICLPDGRIPLFNDSAFGIAPEPSAIFRYAHHILGYKPRPPGRGVGVIAKAASGYFVIQHEDNKMVIDCGEIGPGYQPGHAHCDTLSYELSLAGKRVIVDSGVHDYENSLLRHYARSTAAHNTVEVDGAEQSEIWGVFRIARRAKPLMAMLAKLDENRCRFEGAHDGYRRMAGSIVHARTVEYDGVAEWTIRDEIRGEGTHTVRSYIHIHPDFRAALQGDAVTIMDVSGHCIATLSFPAPVRIDLTKGKYFPEFGVMHDNDVVTLLTGGVLPLRLCYVIRQADE